ncbi:unnamed protein product [Brassica oleracea]
MDSRRWEPGIREEMRAGTETTTGQNRGDLIRGRGVRMETGSFFGKKISGRYRFGGMEGIWISFSISINTRLRRSRGTCFRLFAICIDCLKFWIINGDLAFWYMGSSIRNGLSVWKIMEQWVKTIQGRGDYGHTTVVWVVLLRGEQNGLRWFGLVNWCGRRKYEMLGIWSQVLVSLNHELDRMQIKYARYYVWCCARVSIWYLETADGSWYAGDTPNTKIHQVLGFWVILWSMENYSSFRKRQWKYGKNELIYIGQVCGCMASWIGKDNSLTIIIYENTKLEL